MLVCFDCLLVRLEHFTCLCVCERVSVNLKYLLYRSGQGGAALIFVISSPECVCVFVFSSHSSWTSSPLDVPAGVTQEEGHTQDFSSTFFLRCVP